MNYFMASCAEFYGNVFNPSSHSNQMERFRPIFLVREFKKSNIGERNTYEPGSNSFQEVCGPKIGNFIRN